MIVPQTQKYITYLNDYIIIIYTIVYNISKRLYYYYIRNSIIYLNDNIIIYIEYITFLNDYIIIYAIVDNIMVREYS